MSAVSRFAPSLPTAGSVGFALLALLAPALSVAGAPVARAQDADPAIIEARALFEVGVTAAEEGRWQDAVRAFSAAYENVEQPLILFNLGGALARTPRLVDAADAYRGFLASGASPELRRAATDALAELEARIPRVDVEVEGLSPGDRVELDDEPLEGRQDVELDPGQHRLTVLRGAQSVGEVRFRLREREQRVVVVSVSGEVVSLEDPPPPRSRPLRRSPLLWSLVGAAVAGVVVTSIVVTRPDPSPFVGDLPPGMVTVR